MSAASTARVARPVPRRWPWRGGHVLDDGPAANALSWIARDVVRHAWVPLAAGVALLGLLAAADYLPPGASWWAHHTMTAAAGATVIGFVAVGLVIDSWLRERQAQQLQRISTVAYRSLAQYANDAGRALLAPLVGADLYSLGVPSALPGDVVVTRRRLDRLGFDVTFSEDTGSWRNASKASLDVVLRSLTSERGFVEEAFRTTASWRRRLQEATALWAPVMLVSQNSAADLGRLRDLTDDLELLQEQWRLGGGLGGDPAIGWHPEAAWLSAISVQYWTTIATYERIRDDFAELAALPSDAIVHRRG